jgi:hypothetical protein
MYAVRSEYFGRRQMWEGDQNRSTFMIKELRSRIFCPLAYRLPVRVMIRIGTHIRCGRQDVRLNKHLFHT